MRFKFVLQTAVTLMVSFSTSVPELSAGSQRPEPRRDPSTIQVGVNLVALNVIVNDQMSRAVQGLKKEDFKVYDDGVEQSIAYFGTEDVPVSWGLVLDRSGSMMGMIRDVYQGAVHVVDEGTARDETFVVTFDTRFELVCDFISDRHRLQKCVAGLRAGGRTALWDAIAFGLDHLKQAKHQKKVLVVITDGEDNSSRLTFRDLLERVKEEDALIYTVGMFESRGLAGRKRYPEQELAQLAEAAGARAHFPAGVKQCKEAMKDIAREVSQQYSLGFYPANRVQDGKWHKLKVEVLSESQKEGDLPKYVARTRTGYYAPKGEGPNKNGSSHPSVEGVQPSTASGRPWSAGFVTSFILEVIVYPPIFAIWKWNAEVKPELRAAGLLEN